MVISRKSALRIRVDPKNLLRIGLVNVLLGCGPPSLLAAGLLSAMRITLRTRQLGR